MKQKKIEKWKTEEYKYLSELSIVDLLNNVIEAASGDDYDGCFTRRGEWKFGIAQLILNDRLHTLSEKDFPKLDLKTVWAEVAHDYTFLREVDGEANRARLENGAP